MMLVGATLALGAWALWYVATNYGCGFGSTSAGQCDWVWLRELFNEPWAAPFWMVFIVGVVLFIAGWRRG